jgi:hypothetical protein
MRRLADTYGSWCVQAFNGFSAVGDDEGPVPIGGLVIGNPPTAGKTTVLIVGGLHGREWVPPDALLSFAEKLLVAKKTQAEITYPPFVCAGVTYATGPDSTGPAYVVSAQAVSDIVDRFRLVIVPVVNPDGRLFSLTQRDQHVTDQLWRKNRRNHTPGACLGVDINRNFPIAWQREVFYTVAAEPRARISKEPCSPVFRGPSPQSEPETQALQKFVEDYDPAAFVDVHMSGRNISFPWGVETNQNTDSAQWFGNPAHDRNPATQTGGRDGLEFAGYGEYMPTALGDRLKAVGDGMAAEIRASAGASLLAQTRSVYTVSQSAGIDGEFKTFPGSADDFVFSRQFSDSERDPDKCVAFLIECGIAAGQNPDNPEEDEGEFAPDYDKVYPKIEREVHAAMFGLLKHPSWAVP